MTDEDFTMVLEVSREEFAAYPTWKQQKLKREKQLF